MKTPPICLLFLLGTLFPLGAAPSVFTLDTGEKVVGELLPASTEDTVVLRSTLLGELQLPRARVLSIQPTAVKQPPAANASAAASKPPAANANATASKPPAANANAAASKPPAANANAAASKPPAAAPPPTQGAESPAEEQKFVDRLGELKAPDHWSGNLRLGVNFSRGDRGWTETYSRGQLEIKPPQSPNYYRFNGSYTYRETERGNGTEFKSTDKYDANFTYRRTFREDWFIQNAFGARVDQIKGIDRELQNTVGIGYKYKPSGTFEFLFGLSGGVEDLRTDYDDTRIGLNPLAHVFQEAIWRPSKRTSLVQGFKYFVNPEDSEQYNYELSASIRVRLTSLLGLEFSFNKNFDNDVGNGNAQDDTQWRNALVIYF